MRIAFYAPLKSPHHAVPSGDRRVARLLIDALELAGHQVEVASTLRTYEPAGDLARQEKLRDEGHALASALLSRWRSKGAEGRPDVWFTYHVYYKAPDWLGPTVASGLGIPYVIAEASSAPRRANGPWAMGQAASANAVSMADLVLCPIRDDLACLEPLVSAKGKLLLLPPFLDPAPYANALQSRAAHRSRLAAAFDLDVRLPWIVVVAMMRTGDKVASYLRLASALQRINDLPWQVIVAGNGEARPEVESALNKAAPGRCRFVGEQPAHEVAAVYAASDLYMWPAVNEAYGMAMLEAQAAGLPVVSRAVRGVPDVVCNGLTGLLAPPDDEEVFAALARELMTDAVRRTAMGREAARFVWNERSVSSASRTLDTALIEHCGGLEQGTRVTSR